MATEKPAMKFITIISNSYERNALSILLARNLIFTKPKFIDTGGKIMKQNLSIKTLSVIILLAVAVMVVPYSAAFAQDAKAAAETKLAAQAPAPAEDKPTGEAAVSFLSQYFWRGYELSRNSIVVQPSLTVGYKGFSAILWGNMDTRAYYAGTQNDKSYGSTWNETDFTLSYSKTLGMFNLGAGYIYYALGALNPDAPKRADAQELFVTAGLNTLLSPTLTVYKEVDHYRNWYFLLGVSHAFELNKTVSLKLSATGSYLLSTYADATLFNAGAGYGGYPKFDSTGSATNDKFSNFHDGNLTVSLPIKVAKNITLTPSVSYIFPLSDDAKQEMKGQGMKGAASANDRDSSFIYGGLTASLTF